MCKPVCRLRSETPGCSEYKPQPPRAGRGRWRLHSEPIPNGRSAGAHAGAAFPPFRTASGAKLPQWPPRCVPYVARVAATNVLRRTTMQAPCRRAGAKPRQLHESKSRVAPPRSSQGGPGRTPRGGVPSARRRAGAQPRQLHENKNHVRENASGRSPANFRRTSRGAPARSSRNVRGRSPARAPPLRERVGATPQRGSEKKQRKRGPEKYTRTCWAGRHHIRLTSIFVREAGRGVAPPRL